MTSLMPSGRNRPPRPNARTVPVMIATILALVVGTVGVTVGAIWLVAQPTASDSDEPSAAQDPAEPNQDQAAAPHDQVEHGAADGAVASRPALAGCQQLVTEQAQVVLFADTTLDQWRLHINAMNQLVAGEITAAEATDFWIESEKGAKRNVERFRHSIHDLSNDDCRVQDCRAARAFHNTIAVARPTARTWLQHIRDMDALMAGKITLEQAAESWTQLRHMGERQLSDYDRENREALHARC